MPQPSRVHRAPRWWLLLLGACSEPVAARLDPPEVDRDVDLVLPATDSAEPEPEPADTGDPAPPADSAEPPVVDSSPPEDSAPDTDVDTAGDPPEPEPDPEPVRFLALGDGGRGNWIQYEVAAGMEKVCAEKGCDFAIYLGDNIYEDGVTSVLDDQFEEKFEAPYAELDFPFYMALGNHDWSVGLLGIEAQIAYTDHSEKWTMPARWYAHTQGDLGFFVLDTQPIADGDGAEQADWLAAELAASTSKWKFAYGHHPYVSNAYHGNTGGDFGEFIEANVCGNVDIYFSGHDHALQWMTPVCDTEFVVSGAASELHSIEGGNPVEFAESTWGFVWVEVLGDTLTGVVYDSSGTELFRRELVKG